MGVGTVLRGCRLADGPSCGHGTDRGPRRAGPSCSRASMRCTRRKPAWLRSDPGGDRTHDLLIKSQLLCQLSYRVALKIGGDPER